LLIEYFQVWIFPSTKSEILKEAGVNYYMRFIRGCNKTTSTGNSLKFVYTTIFRVLTVFGLLSFICLTIRTRSSSMLVRKFIDQYEVGGSDSLKVL